jgi:hypothetical protein
MNNNLEQMFDEPIHEAEFVLYETLAHLQSIVLIPE